MKATKTDERDFADMLDHQFPPEFAAYVRRLGGDPRTFVATLEAVANTARSWCTGRFGHP